MRREWMSKNSSSSGAGGIGFGGLLQVAFIVLKLLGKIDWSWWWVWSPTWIGAIIIICVVVIYVLLARRQ